jgi:hypothetical protein
MTTINEVKKMLDHNRKTVWTEDEIFASAMGISLKEYLELINAQQV